LSAREPPGPPPHFPCRRRPPYRPPRRAPVLPLFSIALRTSSSNSK
jgi:hypothetical protein